MREEGLKALLQVVTEVQSSLELKKRVTLILESLEEALDAQASSVLLQKEEGLKLYFQVATGKGAGKITSYEIPVGKGIAGWVAAHQKPLLVHDALADPRFNRELAEKVGFFPSSILCVPLKAQKRLLGVVEVLREKESPPFAQEDFLFLQEAAKSLAMALANSLLYESAKEKARKFKAAQRIKLLFRGESEVANQARELLRRERDRQTPFLLLGEVGTGKSYLAWLLHSLRGSERPFHPLHPVASRRVRWESIFSAVGGGTVLVENVEKLSEKSKRDLDHFLQEGYLHPVTGERTSLQCRLIFTSTVPLVQLQHFPPFLVDLFFSSSFFLPPLRERREDILPLAESFLEKQNTSHSEKKKFSSGFSLFLQRAQLPKNAHSVKELVEAAFLESRGATIYVDDLPAPLRKRSLADFVLPFSVLLKDYVSRLREVAGRSEEEAAQRAGLSLSEWQELQARFLGSKKEKQ